MVSAVAHVNIRVSRLCTNFELSAVFTPLHLASRLLTSLIPVLCVCVYSWFHDFLHACQALNHVIEHTEAINQLRCELSRRIQHAIRLTTCDLDSLFKSIDTSNDGKINFQEMRIGLQKLHIYLSEKQIARLMRVVDVDGSNKLDFGEFVRVAFFEQVS
jgi:hypothetical protein